MRQIILIGGKVALVDNQDFEFISQFKWYSRKDKNTFYAVSAIDGKSVIMSRVILNENDSSVLIDHHDGDGLNNQRYNLRRCNLSQNNANRRPWKNKSSIYLGVYKIGDKFRAASRKDGKLKTAGEFLTENEAALQYNRLAIKHHGEFAKLNIIQL